MKVKELIEELKKLDQEKGIWIEYDGFAIFDAVPDAIADEEFMKYYNGDRVKEGDYIITVG